jgi:hypothetical protein
MWNNTIADLIDMNHMIEKNKNVLYKKTKILFCSDFFI